MKSLLLVLFPIVIYMSVVFSYLKIRKEVNITEIENKKWKKGLLIATIVLVVLLCVDVFSSFIIMKNAPVQELTREEINELVLEDNNMAEYNSEIYRIEKSNDGLNKIKTVPKSLWGIFSGSTIYLEESVYNELK